MIIKAVGCTLTSVALESNGLSLSVSKLACKYVKSRPNGSSNDGASAEFLSKHSSSNLVGAQADNEDASSTKGVADGGNYGTGQVYESGKKYTEPRQISEL